MFKLWPRGRRGSVRGSGCQGSRAASLEVSRWPSTVVWVGTGGRVGTSDREVGSGSRVGRSGREEAPPQRQGEATPSRTCTQVGPGARPDLSDDQVSDVERMSLMLPDVAACRGRTVPLMASDIAIGVAWRTELPQAPGLPFFPISTVFVGADDSTPSTSSPSIGVDSIPSVLTPIATLPLPDSAEAPSGDHGIEDSDAGGVGAPLGTHPTESESESTAKSDASLIGVTSKATVIIISVAGYFVF
ncbi:hypothetical protein C4D60_Mb11t10700 [Musa balbisiana]|uniref:Uncharacterized protein n=1 Tax=Musa balbisiana TaxID=52838 RepID=A0A4S8J3C4_MUSBA|nr:hypothetical protein C4D60_Mb11t10700 [Musa balbisiana]